MITSRSASRHTLHLATAIFTLCLPVAVQAQQLALVSLPDAPSFARLDPAQAPAAQGTAAITGTVLDITDTTIPHASVTLNGPGELAITVFSDNDGYFAATNLRAGIYKVTITSNGLETLVFPSVKIAAGEQRELPRIAMPLASNAVSVTITATPDEIANEQVKAEEKQRVLAIFPNFYSTYIWDAAPLKPHHKFSLAIRSLIDPMSFAATGITAGIEQAHNTFPGYGDGPEGYAKRYGAAYADHVTGRILGSAVFPSIFHQDPRYFYMGSGTAPSRAWYAISSGVICRGDNGHRQLNYSRILGSLAAAGISNLYRSEQDRTVGLTFRNSLIGLGAHAGTNLVREFLFRKLSSNVPDYARGKGTERKGDS